MQSHPRLRFNRSVSFSSWHPAGDSGGKHRSARAWTPPELSGLCWKPPNEPSVCLFNLTADPRETRNLALAHVELATTLVERFVKTYMYQSDYRRLQNFTQYRAGLPENHGGRWMPWIE